MIYTIVEISDSKEITVYESKNESSALKYMNRSVEKYTAKLMSEYSDINEANAIITAETRYRLYFFE
jgi:hypothetical protein